MTAPEGIRGESPAQAFALHRERPRVLLIGEGSGIGPMIWLAERLRGALASSDAVSPSYGAVSASRDAAPSPPAAAPDSPATTPDSPAAAPASPDAAPDSPDAAPDSAPQLAGGATLPSGACWKPLVLLGSDEPFPFRARPSSVIVSGIPTAVIACMPLLETWGIPCRLASRADFPGCFDGPVTALADAWLASLGPPELNEVEIFASGPEAMLVSARHLAARYGVPYQQAMTP